MLADPYEASSWEEEHNPRRFGDVQTGVIRLGCPTQNLTIPASTNRTLRLANLSDAQKVRTLTRENIASLLKIVRWNADHGVNLFRIGQSLIPFASHPAFPYNWEHEHGDELRAIGDLARSLAIRLSMHPGQFIQPGSPKPGVSERSILELRYAARIFDLIGSSDSVIVVHMGGAYGDRGASAARFIETMRSHTDVLRYLALENDERVWSVLDVVQTARSLGVPAVTDALHHHLNPCALTLREVLDLSLLTWKGGRAAEGPPLEPGSQQASRAHAYSVDLRDWRALLDALGGRKTDVMIEAKGKELALVPLGVRIG